MIMVSEWIDDNLDMLYSKSQKSSLCKSQRHAYYDKIKFRERLLDHVEKAQIKKSNAIKKDRLEELKYILRLKNDFEYKNFYTERNIEDLLKYFGTNKAQEMMEN